MASLIPGQVFGSAGASLRSGKNAWAANDDVARVGRSGELRTAALLNELAAQPGGPSVFHDVRLPGSSANVDHLVVSGVTVTIVDSKNWEPGTYVRVFGLVLRGRGVFRHGSSANVSWQVAKLAKALPHAVRFGRPVVMVWASSGTGPVNLGLLRFRGVRVVPADSISHARLTRLVGDKPADAPTVLAIAKALGFTASVKASPTAPALLARDLTDVPPTDLLLPAPAVAPHTTLED